MEIRRRVTMPHDVARFEGLRWFASEADANDAVVLMRISSPEARRMLAFDGNGKFATHIGGSESTYELMEKIALDPPTPFSRIVGLEAVVDELKRIVEGHGVDALDVWAVRPVGSVDRPYPAREFALRLNLTVEDWTR